MNNSSLVSLLISTPTITVLDLRAVFGPALTDQYFWYKTWVQSWIAILGMLDNLAVIIIFGAVLGKWSVCGWCRGFGKDRAGNGGSEISLVSRIYYVIISCFELLNVGSGFIFRITITYLPFAVCIWTSIQGKNQYLRVYQRGDYRQRRGQIV